MKLRYHPETDYLYIELSDRPSLESQEVSPGLVVDFDADGKVAGLEIHDASRNMALDSLQMEGLPLVKLEVAAGLAPR